jgi:hypothetical protein
MGDLWYRNVSVLGSELPTFESSLIIQPAACHYTLGGREVWKHSVQTNKTGS